MMETEIDTIDQHIRALNIPNGFIVPEFYFDQSREEVRAKIHLMQQQTVPNLYFETARESILLKTTKQHTIPKVIPLYRKPLFYYGIAASLLAVGFTMVFQLTTPKEKTNEMAFTSEQIINYLEQSDLKEIATSDVYTVGTELPITIDEGDVLLYADEQLITDEL